MKEDLLDFPIWEFASDEEALEGQDETWVRPVSSRVIPRDSYSLSVSASFRTASGKEIPGFVTVTTAGEIELGHAALLSNQGYVFVPSSSFRGAAEEYLAIAATLGMAVEEVFPLRFTLSAKVEGQALPLHGVFEL